MRPQARLALIVSVFLASPLIAGEKQPAEIAFDGLTIGAFNAANHQPLLAQSLPFWTSPRLLIPFTLGQTTLLSYPEGYGLMGATPLDYLPTFVSPYQPQLAGADMQSPANRSLPNFLSSFNSASGEVGFFYGKGTGKSNLEATSGYILGEINNGNTQINVGASYSRTTAREPH